MLPQRLCSLRAWRWAAATMASRTMHLPADAAGALAPFADLHNHRPSPGPEPPAIGAPAGISGWHQGPCWLLRALWLCIWHGSYWLQTGHGSTSMATDWFRATACEMQVTLVTFLCGLCR